MTISFNCECCKKKVKAPDKAGGKWGACPYCQHKCYIPMPKSDDEPELKLTPVDESELSHMDDLMKETHTLTQRILKEDTMAEERPQDKDKIQCFHLSPPRFESLRDLRLVGF